MPFFSVIIATRNRPEVLSQAINSVFAQSFNDYEIIVVDDGSESPISLEQLQLDEYSPAAIKIVHLGHQLRGRGPGYARNVGVWASSGNYCAFLDDDDIWSRCGHLLEAHAAIQDSAHTTDLYFSNQEAVTQEGSSNPLWLYPVAAMLEKEGRPLVSGAYTTNADELIGVGGFCHLNTTIVRRVLFDHLGGLDEYLAYEEDLDFYLRAIDKASHILYSPAIVGRHNVPDKSQQKSASTALSQLNKLNIRLYLLNKNIFSAEHQSIAKFCSQYAVSTTKHIAQHYVAEQNYAVAYQFAMRALGARLSMKWFLYCAYLRLKAWSWSPDNHE